MDFSRPGLLDTLEIIGVESPTLVHVLVLDDVRELGLLLFDVLFLLVLLIR